MDSAGSLKGLSKKTLNGIVGVGFLYRPGALFAGYDSDSVT